MTKKAYSVTMTRPGHKTLKKIPLPIRLHLINQAKTLADNPHKGQRLEGKFKPFRSLHVIHKRVHYRIVYEINASLKEIIIRAVGKREGFYSKLSRLKLKPF